MSKSDTELVQLYMRRITVDRLKRGTEPVFDLVLGPHERIVQVDHFTLDYARRETVDHIAKVWIEARLG